MIRLLPFQGLRYDKHVVGDLASVVCPPYDVIGAAEQARLQAASPYNAVHVELPAPPPGSTDGRYRRAAETFDRWRREAVLVRDPRPAYYLHETTFTHRGTRLRRRDLIAALGLAPWSARQVLPHEDTMAGPKADRLALMEATRANVSPVWVLARSFPPSLEDAWRAADERDPETAFALGEEEHRLWRLDNPDAVHAVEAEFAAGGPLYIADGHHRYETALAFAEGAGRGLEAAQATLAVVTAFDDPGLVVLPTHRLLRGLPPTLSQEELEVRWSDVFHAEYFPVWEDAPPEQVEQYRQEVEVRGKHAPAFGLYGPARDLFGLVELRGRKPPDDALPRDRSAAWKELDVALIHALAIDPLVEETGQPREAVLSYTRDFHAAFDAVRRGEADVAFFLNPTPVHQVLAVADAGDRMPEKSTYFYPKPPTGLVFRTLDR